MVFKVHTKTKSQTRKIYIKIKLKLLNIFQKFFVKLKAQTNAEFGKIS